MILRADPRSEKVFYTTIGERPPRTNGKKGLAGPGTAADFLYGS
jgi:hypothetical protein